MFLMRLAMGAGGGTPEEREQALEMRDRVIRAQVVAWYTAAGKRFLTAPQQSFQFACHPSGNRRRQLRSGVGLRLDNSRSKAIYLWANVPTALRVQSPILR